MPTLVLFDIDGTLLASNHVGSKAMTRVWERFVGEGSPLNQVPLAGRCDWAIWRDVLHHAGYSHEEADTHLPELFRLYIAELAHILASPEHPNPDPLPGVRTLLTALHLRDDLVLGLLTGNVEAGAWLKLGKAKLDSFFRFGAFGNEAADRSALPPIAVARASTFASGHTFTGQEIVIVGDTPHDIQCGEALGVRTIGVATGSYDSSALHSAGADHVFATFEETEAVLAALTVS